MKAILKTLFLDSPNLDEKIVSFLAQDPEFAQAEQEFYETAHEIAQLVGFERYDRFERRLGRYTARLSVIHYLFGLGLRQEVLRAMED